MRGTEGDGGGERRAWGEGGGGIGRTTGDCCMFAEETCPRGQRRSVLWTPAHVPRLVFFTWGASVGSDATIMRTRALRSLRRAHSSFAPRTSQFRYFESLSSTSHRLWVLVTHSANTVLQNMSRRGWPPSLASTLVVYSRSLKNLARQLSQNSYKSAFTGSQRPICKSGATVGVRGFCENGCSKWPNARERQWKAYIRASEALMLTTQYRRITQSDHISQ